MSAGMIECWMKRDLETLYRDLCSLKHAHFYARGKEERDKIECDIFVVEKIMESEIKRSIEENK